MLKNDWTVEKTCHCLVQEDIFSVKQWQHVVRISSSELQESLLNDCDEPDVDYVAVGQGTPVLDLTCKLVAFGEYNGCGDSGDSNPHQKESSVNEEDSAEEIGESQVPPRRSE